jgi:hypothetical protein
MQSHCPTTRIFSGASHQTVQWRKQDVHVRFMVKSLYCWRNNLDLEAVKWNTIMKVGVAPLHPPTLLMHNVYPRRCLKPLQHCIFNKIRKSLLKEVDILQATCWYNEQIRYNVSFPSLRTVTPLPVVMPLCFMTQTIHSIY